VIHLDDARDLLCGICIGKPVALRVEYVDVQSNWSNCHVDLTSVMRKISFLSYANARYFTQTGAPSRDPYSLLQLH
jgi:hypothetical protein